MAMTGGSFMRRFIDFVAIAAVIACLMPSAAAGQSKSIIVGEGVRGAMYMPAYIAEEKGYFKKRDLDSKIVTFSRSNDINALVSGDIQFDQTSPDKVIHSALGGFPVKMVMATTRGLNLALVVHPSIKSAADLKGKSVAVTSFSGLPYTGLLLCLKELGLAKEQVVPLNIGGKAARFEALVHNRVPAAILDPPYTTMAAKEGFKLIVDLAPLDVPYLRNIVAVSEKSLRDDSRTIAKFVEALSEGMQFYRNKANKEENMRILARYLRVPLDKNRAMIEEGYETYRDMLLKKPYADAGAMKILVDVIAESNPKAKNLNLTTLIDSSFVERLDREGAFGK
jgi:NitT/TauT family transport system substrate-binding protein